MIRDMLRAVGIGCILAGGILYFANSETSGADAEIQQMQDKVELLQSELSRTNEELAIAQTATSVTKSSSEIDKRNQNDKSKVDKTVSAPPKVIKTIVTIEPGSNSTIVAASLEALGVIKVADEFNTFLTNHKLSGKIQIGEHEVNSSMDFQTIAKVITTVK